MHSLDQPTSFVRSKVQKSFVSLPDGSLSLWIWLPSCNCTSSKGFYSDLSSYFRQTKPNNASLNRDVLLKLWPAFYPNRGRDSACRHKAEHNGVVKYHGVIYPHQNKVASPDKKGICKYCWSRRQHAELLTLWITLDVSDLRQVGHYLHITDAWRTQTHPVSQFAC